MAATVRLTGGPLLVVGVGGFGEQVAQLLSAGDLGATRVRPDDLADAFAARPAAVVLAAQHPVPELGSRIDNLAWQHGVPWMPVVTEDLLLRIGPWVVPHQGPCFDCYRARLVQHDDQASITSALWKAHETDPGGAPRGFLPQHARTAVGLLHCLLDGPDGVRATPGSVTAVRLHYGDIDTQPVLRCHGCRRCAPETVPGPDRTGALAELVCGARTTHQGVPA
ncbi:TOMM precursor leader peptide-binding protein [Streptomyces avidinii]|uniref:TOMM precursor leader peptide-binding protein n=1 Tax=Streptomyces avidinii TaxID=1895 RepID=UPI00386564E6|nr:TOMM precursor leader peptide-binding protein [Streptomyces avidinii]